MAGYTTTKCHRIIKTTRNKYLRLRLISHFFSQLSQVLLLLCVEIMGHLPIQLELPREYNLDHIIIKRMLSVDVKLLPSIFTMFGNVIEILDLKAQLFTFLHLLISFYVHFFSFSYSTQTNYYNSTFIVMEYPENVGLVKSSWSMFER